MSVTDAGLDLPEGRVVLLFTDVQGSTALLHELGDAYGDVLVRHDEIMREAWRAHGGVEVDNEGDSFFVAFEDAASAVAAATQVQASMTETRWPGGADVRVRMALHAGEPRVRGRRYWGIDVNYAARLCSAAHGGQVLLSAAMRGEVPGLEVESLGEHGLKDFATPRELFHLVLDGSRSQDFPSPRTLSLVRTNVPTISTPIIGRESEVSELVGRLTDGGDRLVTLVGRGGIGKTRTAIACAEQLAGEFRDGVTFVALASAENVESALTVLSDAVGAPKLASVDPVNGLVAHLRDRKIVLVLDNAEHLHDIGPVIATLLEGAGQLRMLATSQSPLGIRGETVVRAEPLGVPNHSASSASDVLASPAARMFVERARSRDSSFEVTDANAESVARLCVALEGMPLALELAAARATTFGVAGLVQALERDPDALGTGPADLPERQRGLRAALDWTVSLLSADEREVFAGLAAFAAAWTLEQAEQIFVDERRPFETWEVMSRLLDLSLVIARGDGRCTMAERVRRHAAELLVTSGREDERRRRHVELMTDEMDRRGRTLVPDLLRVVANVEEAAEETLQALAWSARNDQELHRRLVAMSAFPFAQVGRMSVLAGDLLSYSPSECQDRIDGYILLGQALVHGMGAHDPSASRDAAQEGRDCLRQHGDDVDRFVAFVPLFFGLLSCDAPDAAGRLIDETLEDAVRVPESGWTDAIEGFRAQVSLDLKDLTAAEQQVARITARPERTDWAAALVETSLGDLAFERGDYLAATGHYARMLQRLPERHLDNALMQIQGIAAALAGLQRDHDAVELLEGINHVYGSRTGRVFEIQWPSYVPTVSAARSRISLEATEVIRVRAGRLTYEKLRERAFQFAADLSRVT